MSSRTELINIQKRLVKRFKQEIYADYCRENPQIESYFEDYKRATAAYRQPATKKELLTEILNTRLVYLGDYHTLRQSQKTLLRLVQSFRNTPAYQSRFSGIIFALEAIPSHHQKELDEYLAGTLDELTFLNRIDYAKVWGFDWEHYRIIFDYARAHKIKVQALNSLPTEAKERLLKRDQHAAEIICAALKSDPEAIIFTLFGDLHIAENHLPARVDEACKATGQPAPPRVIIYQNSERIYWQLAEAGLHEEVEVVGLKEHTYCIINTTPLAVFQSCLNWQCRQPELKVCPISRKSEDYEPEEDILTQIVELIKAICQFLSLDIPDLNKLTVYTPHNFDALERWAKESLSAEEIERIESDILKTESYFIPEKWVIFLTNFSINHAAEEAAHFIYHHYTVGISNKEIHRSLTDRFYYTAIRETLGYFGSKIINHKRQCYKVKDYQETIAQPPADSSNPKARELRTVSRFVLRHKMRETNYLKTDIWKKISSATIKRLGPALSVSINHALGYMLGEKLYEGVVQEKISRSEMRELFLKPLAKRGEPLAAYLYLVKRLATVEDPYPKKEDHL